MDANATEQRNDPRHRSKLTSAVVIPARTASTRLPRKLLLRQTGKSLLQHSYEAALAARKPDRVLIAAGDQEIMAEARRMRAPAMMTDPHAASGTDRIIEVATRMTDVELFVNLQADEPELPAAVIDDALSACEDNPAIRMVTIAAPIRTEEELFDPACVKVVFDDRNRALYFSRSPIPHVRDGLQPEHFRPTPRFFKHIGLYVYRRSLLMDLAQLPVSPLESLERLEQLRVLAAGEAIQIVITEHAACGIDTAEDYARFVSRMSA